VAFPGDEVGLINPRGAMLVVGVRSYGQPMSGQVKEQIRTYNGGGCTALVPPTFVFNDHDACDDEPITVFVP
jgi:hypothetical protein